MLIRAFARDSGLLYHDVPITCGPVKNCCVASGSGISTTSFCQSLKVLKVVLHMRHIDIEFYMMSENVI